MTSTENIKIMSWDVRGYGTCEEKMREDIMKQKTHILVLQETKMWINNARDLWWKDARVLNMETIRQTKGKLGGLEIVISPEIEFTDLYRTAIGINPDDMIGEPLDPKHTEYVDITNAEQAIQDGIAEVEQLEMEEKYRETDQQQTTHKGKEKGKNKSRRRDKKSQGNKTSRTNAAANKDGQRETVDRSSKDKQGDVKGQTKKKEQEFIQDITLQLINGMVVSGTYVRTQTGRETTTKFLTETLESFRPNHVVVGYINARRYGWDRTSNARGLSVLYTLNKLGRTYVVAPKHLSYYRVENRKDGTKEIQKSNPDIALSRTVNAKEEVVCVDWGKI